MAAKIVDIADEIHRELGNPTDLSIPPISYWLTTNLGQLNNLLNLTLTLDEDNLEFSTDLDDQQKVIFKKLYFVHYYNTKVRATLGAASTDSVVEVSSDGARVRKINKNELLSLQKMVYVFCFYDTFKQIFVLRIKQELLQSVYIHKMENNVFVKKMIYII